MLPPLLCFKYILFIFLFYLVSLLSLDRFKKRSYSKLMSIQKIPLNDKAIEEAIYAISEFTAKLIFFKSVSQTKTFTCLCVTSIIKKLSKHEWTTKIIRKKNEKKNNPWADLVTNVEIQCHCLRGDATLRTETVFFVWNE